VLPSVLVAPNLLSGATDSRRYRALSPNIYRFVPMRLNPKDLDRLHGTNERLGIESYGEIVRFYAQLLRNGTA
jgi:carboxypeptidase PM20D1